MSKYDYYEKLLNSEATTNEGLERILLDVIDRPAMCRFADFNVSYSRKLKELIFKYIEMYDKKGISYDYNRAMIAVSILNDVLYVFGKYQRDDLFSMVDYNFDFGATKTWMVWNYVVQQREKGGDL